MIFTSHCGRRGTLAHPQIAAGLRSMMTPKSPGLAAALASAVLFGATTPIAKQLLAGASPLLVAGLLYLGSGIGVSLLRVVRDRGWSATGLAQSDWPWLAAATVAGGIVAPVLLLVGLTRADAAI